jgi:hypothetical protein
LSVSAPIRQAAIKLLRARERNDRAVQEEKAAKKEVARATAELADLLQDEEVPSITIDLGPPFGQVRLVPGETRYAQVVDPEDLREALADEGLEEELFLPKPAKARLNELVNERLDHGQELPQGLSWYPKRKVTVTRLK